MLSLTTMTKSRIRSTISLLIERQRVEDADVERLRDLLAAGGGLSTVEAGDLVRLERHVREMSPLWISFFIEQIATFFIWERRPTGQISERDLEWLFFRLGLDSTGATPSTRALLTILSEECVEPPPLLKKRLDMLSGARARRLAKEKSRPCCPSCPRWARKAGSWRIRLWVEFTLTGFPPRRVIGMT